MDACVHVNVSRSVAGIFAGFMGKRSSPARRVASEHFPVEVSCCLMASDASAWHNASLANYECAMSPYGDAPPIEGEGICPCEAWTPPPPSAPCEAMEEAGPVQQALALLNVRNAAIASNVAATRATEQLDQLAQGKKMATPERQPLDASTLGHDRVKVDPESGMSNFVHQESAAAHEWVKYWDEKSYWWFCTRTEEWFREHNGGEWELYVLARREQQLVAVLFQPQMAVTTAKPDHCTFWFNKRTRRHFQVSGNHGIDKGKW